MRDPTIRKEWQEAVDAAYVLLLLDSARQYGLVAGGPAVNSERAEQILARGKQRGILPRPDALDRLFDTYVQMHRCEPPPKG